MNLDKMNFFERGLFKFIFKVKESYSKINDESLNQAVEAIKKLDEK